MWVLDEISSGIPDDPEYPVAISGYPAVGMKMTHYLALFLSIS